MAVGHRGLGKRGSTVMYLVSALYCICIMESFVVKHFMSNTNKDNVDVVEN